MKKGDIVIINNYLEPYLLYFEWVDEFVKRKDKKKYASKKIIRGDEICQFEPNVGDICEILTINNWTPNSQKKLAYIKVLKGNPGTQGYCYLVNIEALSKVENEKKWRIKLSNMKKEKNIFILNSCNEYRSLHSIEKICVTTSLKKIISCIRENLKSGKIELHLVDEGVLNTFNKKVSALNKSGLSDSDIAKSISNCLAYAFIEVYKDE